MNRPATHGPNGAGRVASAQQAGRSVPSRGFSLLELLMVVVILALLISMLQPVLRRARDIARRARCIATLRGFGTGLATYASEFDQWIPGHNTTGIATWQTGLGGPERLQSSVVPVQTYDWMTPTLRSVTSLPASRPARFRVLLEEFACPSVNFYAALYVNREAGETMPIDHAAFVAEVEQRGAYRGGSYLMPEHFQRWGQADQPFVGFDPATRQRYDSRRNPSGNGKWEVEIESYRSRVDEVGSPSEKIAVADGTRYLPRSLVLDFDHHHRPEYFGAFCSAGGWWRGSTAYGDQSPSKGKNIPLSFRHRGGLNALFFDGHAAGLSRREARKIDYWYPRGGVVVKSDEGFTDWQRYRNGDVIR